MFSMEGVELEVREGGLTGRRAQGARAQDRRARPALHPREHAAQYDVRSAVARECREGRRRRRHDRQRRPAASDLLGPAESGWLDGLAKFERYWRAAPDSAVRSRACRKSGVGRHRRRLEMAGVLPNVRRLSPTGETQCLLRLNPAPPRPSCRCFRCATWSFFPTWSSRCSSDARNRSRRSKRRWNPGKASCWSRRNRPPRTIRRRKTCTRSAASRISCRC